MLIYNHITHIYKQLINNHKMEGKTTTTKYATLSEHLQDLTENIGTSSDGAKLHLRAQYMKIDVTFLICFIYLISIFFKFTLLFYFYMHSS